jgi:PAS domain-containing protein
MLGVLYIYGMNTSDMTKEQLLEELEKCRAENEPGREGLKRAGELVLKVEQDWENIFNTITDMVTIHDADFNIISANKSAEKNLDLPMMNIGNIKCYKYYHGTEGPPEGCPSCQCLQSGEPVSFEIFEPHLKKHVEIRAIPRLDEDGKVIGLIHIVRDITRRKKAEEELEKHRLNLKDLVEERTSELMEANKRLKQEIGERKRAEKEKEKLIEELQEAFNNIKTLRGLIPICAWCKKVRDDRGYWKQVEDYIREHSDADFTHGICSECMKRIEDEEKDEEGG